MTSAPGAFLTVNAGGALEGVVAIRAVTGQLLVSATWTRDGEPRRASVTLADYDAARTLTHRWADDLAAGREPAGD